MQARVSKIILGVTGWCCAVASASPTYFLVAEPDFARLHHDSFVLPLIQPDDIAHARDLIARGPQVAGAPIVFAEIGESSEGINRDLFDLSRPAWSWKVQNFDRFGDIGIELLDGWPGYVEKNRQTWFAQTGELSGNGRIGFWNYTVVTELPGYPDPVPPIAVIPLPSGLASGALTIGLIGIGWIAARKRRWR